MNASFLKQSDKGLITPDNCAICFIDHQPQMNFGVANINRDVLLNNTVMLAKAAKVFNVPVILTTIGAEEFGGYMYPQILDVFPGQPVIDRTSINAWEDKPFRAAVEKTGRRNLIMSALWTELCLALPAIQASVDGFNVLVVEDACGGFSEMVHQAAMRRVEAAGAVPVTAMQVFLELQRDWARKETYDDVMAVLKEHAGAYGQGIEYSSTMRLGQPPTRKHPDGAQRS